MIRLAFLQATLPVGGAERLAQSLMRALDPGRFDTLAINLFGPGAIGEQLAAEGRTVVSGIARDRWDLRAGERLARVMEERRVDLAYLTEGALPLFWAGWLRRRRPRPRFVLGFHSTRKAAGRLRTWAACAYACPVMDRFVALAPGHRDYLFGAYRLDPARTAVIGNGVDTDRFRPAADRAEAKRAVGLDPGELHVGIVAALRPEKHHALFLRMADRIAARIPAARFLVIGDGPERARLERLAAGLAHGSSVRFLGARHDTPGLFRALDVSVLCSRPVVETFPVTLVESLASGLPVVSTRVGSIADIVTPGRTGTLVPSGDLEALSGAVGRLLEDPALRARMGAAARAEAERRFTEGAMVEAYARLFEEVGR